MNHLFSKLAVSVALAGEAQAAILVDNFESYSPLLGDIDTQGGWSVINGTPNNPGDGPVVIIDSYTWDLSSQSVTVGGVEPTVNALTSLSHSANVELAAPTGFHGNFSVETSYTESTSGGRNPFQFVWDANSGNLLTIDLTPGATGTYDVSWSSGLGPAGGSLGTLLAGATTQFALETWWNGTNIAYSLTNAGSPVSSGIFSGAAQTDVVNNFAVNWYSNIGSVGNGSITVDNLSLVPEASSALLGLIGASSLCFRRRRL